MSSWLVPVTEGCLMLMAAALAWRGRRSRRWRSLSLPTGLVIGERGPVASSPVQRRAMVSGSSWLAKAMIVGTGAGAAGWVVAGPIGALIGLVAGVAGPAARRRHRKRQRQEAIEDQLVGLAESMSLGLRSGLSVVQALDFARAEAIPPLREHLDRCVEERRIGVPFDVALGRLGDALGTDDATFLVLVTGIHARSGGNLAGALDQVGQTLRHRVAVRRELRAASAQGRISGVILGSLPIGFFLFLSITSRSRLSPVFRSGAGMAMVSAGLFMEGLAYLWIRRLLRVEV